ncbi:SMI1/KNR4 family protein [Micromonospora sp. WMMA1363]|uniref:SMI1/KNR4 family protein n=1 Tax=Micromonospora sp. WMMA1363 TaxID=3053985 RepID=UPI00259D0832|nr:SMI1/KNR4 family protein [Micromonospora sp. WMMA1363]MDM4723176.1 SMI1/KNR4 family protein [Micromonospora sp. WMMA1363]MDM4723182.1 SMI1/KNR4 family protein [Micromonospora sp. WMMA1363]MDM4723188.1 SMI1/KNR4 family protein [Micromonospora sp. WMMA1363]
MIEIFEDNDYYTGPQLDAGRVRQAEESLGVRLPRSYVELLLQRNGGVPRRRCYPTDFSTSWAPDRIQISAIRGIGGEWGIDSTSGLGSADMIAEWGYPEIGVVICDMPSAGHDAVMLDYSASGDEGDPTVAYIDEDRVVRRLAASFEDFLSRLVSCDRFA